MLEPPKKNEKKEEEEEKPSKFDDRKFHAESSVAKLIYPQRYRGSTRGG